MSSERSLTRLATFGVILLFISGTFPVTASMKDTPASAPRGSILYVGGTGPGNYTKIQDAVNDSEQGDTVFVYQDSSPYREHITIDHSIILLGENEQTTEINGSTLKNTLDTVNITGDHVTLSGFHITENHGYYYQAAVKLLGDYISISNCSVDRNTWVGIFLVGASFCQILDCELGRNLVAVNLERSRSNIIKNCTCAGNSDGITLYDSSNTNHIISCTCINNGFDSIHVQQSSDNQIIDCTCRDGYDGISLAYTPGTVMRGNIMMNNYMNFGIGSSLVSDYYCDIDTSNSINGEPMYYLTAQHDLLFDETTPVGFLGFVSCQNITVRNLTFTNNFEGMLFADTQGALVDRCDFSANDGHGMYIVFSTGIMVRNSTFQDSFFDGVFLYKSTDNTLDNCSYAGFVAGIRLESSTRTLISRQTIEQCSLGVLFDESANNQLTDNHLMRCGLQVSGGNLLDYLNTVDPSTTVNNRPVYYYVNETNLSIPSDAGQVILVNCTGCTVTDLNLSNASIGLELAYSKGNAISHNLLCDNDLVGIDLDGSDNDNNLIEGNTLRRNNYGVDVDASSHNMILTNILSGNGLGLSFDFSSQNTVTGNIISDGYYGVYLDSAPQNTLTGNKIQNNSLFGVYFFSSGGDVLRENQLVNCSLMVYATSLQGYLNDVDESNTVNGKPVYYLLHQNGITPPQDAGQVLLVDCQRCTVENLEVTGGTMGITLAYCSNSSITGNLISDQSVTGIDLGNPGNTDILVQGNVLTGNQYGIDSEFSVRTNIKRNLLVSNTYGIVLYHALNATIQRNSVLSNSLGIYVEESPGSRIHLNNIFRNYGYGLTVDACDVSARRNWWGSVTGPTGDGDSLQTINNGQVLYTPWKVLPVLLAGLFGFLLLPRTQQQAGASQHMAPSMLEDSLGTREILSPFLIRNKASSLPISSPQKIFIDSQLL